METKNYESRLEEAKKLYQTANKDQKYLLESLFPEIIEDEDERVRKVLLDVCDMSLPDIWVKRGIEKEQVIAWLEKQAKKPADMVEPKDYSSIDPHFFKPADNVEPKFKIGDWITDGEAVFHITSYDIDYGYQLEIQKGTSFHFSDEKVENKYHLWTIKDAKDGDVLYSPCLSLLWIFKSRDTIYCGCNLNYNDGAFCGEGYFERPTDAIPVTKEQRELLFQKMKEAGYEWDADKKELKKKSQRMISAEAKEALYNKTSWSEEDERICRNIVNDIANDKSMCKYEISKGICDEQINWLKSLKDRITWRPSEEQMKALEYVINNAHNTSHSCKIAKELLEQLKKLK